MKEKFNRETFESSFSTWDLEKQKKDIKGKIFNKVKKNILIELKNSKVEDTDTQERIKDAIKLLEKIDGSIIVFDSDRESEIQAETTFYKKKNNSFFNILFSNKNNDDNLIAKDITFFTNIFKYSSTLGIELIVYHELKHFLKLERLDYNTKKTHKYLALYNDKNIDRTDYKNRKEFFTKLSSFRYYMKQRYGENYTIIDIKNLFSEIKKEIEFQKNKKLKNPKKLKFHNKFGYNEETQLLTIYKLYKDEPEKLIFDIKYIVSNEIDRNLLKTEINKNA